MLPFFLWPQAQEHVKRFLSARSAERSSVVLLTNAAITQSLSIGPVPLDKGMLVRVVHFDAPEGQKNEAARERISEGVFHGRGAGMVEEVHLEGGEAGSGLVPFVFEDGAMSGIRSRYVQMIRRCVVHFCCNVKLQQYSTHLGTYSSMRR